MHAHTMDSRMLSSCDEPTMSTYRDATHSFPRQIHAEEGIHKEDNRMFLLDSFDSSAVHQHSVSSHCHDISRLDRELPLGLEFKPAEWDVICGRGKASFDHVGNRRLRLLVANSMHSYVEAKSRVDKTAIVQTIVEQIREASPNGGFVRKDDFGEWYEIGTKAAREKVGHAIRDCLTEPLRGRSLSTYQERLESLQEVQDEVFRSLKIAGIQEREGQANSPYKQNGSA